MICDSQVDAHHVVKTVAFNADVTMFNGFTKQQTRRGGGPHLFGGWDSGTPAPAQELTA